MLATLPSRHFSPDRQRARLELLLFLLVFCSYAYFYQSGQHNENARFDTVRAILEHRNFIITPYAHNTADGVPYHGEVYSSKAPGLAFAAVIPWWSWHKLLRFAGVGRDLSLELACYFTIYSTISLLSALAAVLLFRIIHDMFHSSALALALALFYALGSIAFPFSTLFFGHQFCAALLTVAFYLLYRARQSNLAGGQAGTAKLFFAGFCAGFAVVSEYPCAIGLGALLFYALLGLPRRQSLLFVVPGAACALLFLLGYNLSAFGGPFVLPYTQYKPSDVFGIHHRGIGGISWPRWDAFLGITFLPRRGLFFCNPWLLLVIPGLVTPLWNKSLRLELSTAALAVLAFFFMNAGFGDTYVYWGGGTSVGPRHLIPVLPFAVLLIAPLLRNRWLLRICFILGLLSIAVMLMATAVEPRAGYEYDNPVRQLFWRNYLHGWFALHTNGIFSARLFAFNLGKLLKLPGWLQLVPLLAFWGVMSILLIRRLRAAAPADPYLPGRAAAVAPLLMLVALAVTPAVRQMRLAHRASGTGLETIYYSGLPPSQTRCPRYSSQLLTLELPATRAGVSEPRLDPWSPPPLQGNFTAVWHGCISVPETGLYQFATIADDGACLYADNRIVTDNSGSHALQERRGYAFLTRGSHRFLVMAYNVFGGAGLEVLWAPPGSGLQPMPMDVLGRCAWEEEQ